MCNYQVKYINYNISNLCYCLARIKRYFDIACDLSRSVESKHYLEYQTLTLLTTYLCMSVKYMFFCVYTHFFVYCTY